MKEVKILGATVDPEKMLWFQDDINKYLANGWEIAHFAGTEKTYAALLTRDVTTPTPDMPISAAPDGQTLGERLRWLRNRSNETLGTIALLADISLPYLSDLECGRTLPGLLVMARLAAAYGITASDLLRGVVLTEEDEE